MLRRSRWLLGCGWLALAGGCGNGESGDFLAPDDLRRSDGAVAALDEGVDLTGADAALLVGDASGGCLGDGRSPPGGCLTGKDPESGADWVVCAADCDNAWLSHAGAGGDYHALQICRSLGYAQLGLFGDDCGSVCGHCDVNTTTSCSLIGTLHFDETGRCGNDQFGPILCRKVDWQCLK